jgi:2,3-dihydroxybenzoate-AMP ligase
MTSMIGDDAAIVPYPAEAVERYVAAGVWQPRTIAAAFRATAAAHGGRTALITQAITLTYAELDQRSDAVALGLAEAGLEPGDRVLLQITNSATAIVAWYGLQKAGLIPVCTHPIHRKLEIEQIGRQTGAVAHLVQADFPGFDLVGLAREMAGLLPALRTVLTIGAGPAAQAPLAAPAADAPPGQRAGIRIEDLERTPVTPEGRAALAAVDAGRDPDRPAVFQLSGGTTGTPKVIPRLHAEYWHNAVATARWWGHDERSVLAFGLPIAHNAALSNGLHSAHAVGAALLLGTPQSDVMVPMMAAHGATWTMSPPGLAVEYMRHRDFDAAAARLSTWVLTAARTPRAVFDALSDRGVLVTQAFGMSEGLFMFTPPDADAEVRFATIGSPISPLDEVLVLAPGTDAEVAEGEPGELCARGPYTIRGYLAAPERNREAFTAAGYYRSGDLVRAHRTPHGVAYSVEGRIKDLIDRGGEKINAEEVESLLVQHPGVAEAGLVAMPDPRLGERGCVYVVPRDPATPPDLAGLCRYLEERGLAKYKWPERLELVDALPRTPVGKLAKNALRADITAKLAADSGR